MFEATYKVTKPIYKSTHLKVGKDFMIQSRMGGNRVLFWGNHIGGGQYQMRIRKPQYNKHELFFFDPTTGHIRSRLNRNFVVAVEKNKKARGAKLVIRRAEENND